MPDSFTVGLILAVCLASVAPITGHAAIVFSSATQLAVAMLFFLNGIRLSRQSVVAGITHWRLHVVVGAATFVLFPLLGIAIQFGFSVIVGPGLAMGLLFLCCLPSTIQSSVAFTSIAKGNVPAAICSATLSNLAGIVITPLLAGVLMATEGNGGVSLDQAGSIVMQLLLPFIVGQGVRPWLVHWAHRHTKLMTWTDRGSILMIVYGAFSEAVAGGLWHNTPPLALAVMGAVCCLLLALVLLVTYWAGVKLGFNQADRIAIVFCGSKKSMASGIPMANVLFPAATIGMIALPIMLFHQIQLMVCAALARHYAAKGESAS